jgi:cation transport regulator ChaC
MNDGKLEIAILAWGSLMWEVRPEFDEQHEKNWRLDGPTLKVEFSRISTTRQGALTLVIDNKNGVDTTVAWCLSKRQRIEDTICDLRCREGTTLRNIRSIRLPTDSSSSPCPIIATWASERHLDAVIWTALESNFNGDGRPDFSVSAAVEHIKTLDPCGKAMAAEYIWRAPAFVKTPLRDALQQEPWFSLTKPINPA